MMLAIVSVALLLISLDMTVLYTALPTLTHDLEASASQKLWIVNAYPLVITGLLLGIGSLGDRFGHRHLFTSGLLVFGAASLFAALSPTPAILIIARVILAIGAAMMLPATLSLIRIHFTDRRERTAAIGVWSSVFAGGAGLGPIVGGFLLDYFYWGSVFLINVPIVLIASTMAFFIIPKDAGNAIRKWDWFGSLQVMIGLVGIVFAIKEVTRRGGVLEIAALTFVIGVIALISFVKRQKRLNSPLLDFSLFKRLPFSTGFITALLACFILVGTQLVITQRYQLVVGYTPLDAAFYMISIPVVSFITGIMTGIFLDRFRIIYVQLVALLLATVGLASFLLVYDGSSVLQVLALAVLGAGLGMASTSASNAIMDYAPEEKAGMAASIEEVSYELGGVLGVGIIGSLSSFFYTYFLHVPPTIDVPAIVTDSLDEALLISEGLDATSASILVEAAKTAYDQSFIVAILLTILFTLIGALFLFISRKKDM